MCRERRGQQGVTTTRATARQAEQRSWACRAWCNQVHSVVTQEVKVIEAEKLSAHAVRVTFASGQLLFLGSIALGTNRFGQTQATQLPVYRVVMVYRQLLFGQHVVAGKNIQISLQRLRCKRLTAKCQAQRSYF